MGVFQNREVPETLNIHQFLVRVGEFGGYAVVETEDLADVQKPTTTFAVFQFRLEPVMDAVAAEVEGITWRESNATS